MAFKRKESKVTETQYSRRYKKNPEMKRKYRKSIYENVKYRQGLNIV